MLHDSELFEILVKPLPKGGLKVEIRLGERQVG